MERGHSGGALGTLWLACLTLGVALPASAQDPTKLHRTTIAGQEVQLWGTVRFEGATTAAHEATVDLQDSEGRVVGEQPVSQNGQFFFLNLPKVVYTLIATADGYETYVQLLDLRNEGGNINVDIVLRPVQNKEIAAPGDAARTDATAPMKARKEYERGDRAFAERKLSEAHTHFQKAVSIYPCYARAQVGLAQTLMRERDSAHAEAPLRKALECDPDFVAPYFHLGRLLNDNHRYLESRSVLTEGIRRAPGSWQLYYHLGQADEGLKNYALAEQELLRALSFGPTVSPAVHEKLADVYLRENAYEKAYAEMRAYLQADPDGPYAARIRTVMQQLEAAGRVPPTPRPVAPGRPMP